MGLANRSEGGSSIARFEHIGRLMPASADCRVSTAIFAGVIAVTNRSVWIGQPNVSRTVIRALSRPVVPYQLEQYLVDFCE